jgi:hypothetical protein
MTPETIQLLDQELAEFEGYKSSDLHFTVNPVTFHAWSLLHEYKGVKIFQDEWAPINNIYLSTNYQSC